VAVPALLPPIKPGLNIVAMPGALLVHTPPGVALDKVVVNPTHIPRLPVIAAGPAFTVTIVVVKQPLPSAYVIVDVPGLTPVTTPVPEIVATAGVELLHAPKDVELLSVMELPTHTAVPPPVMAVGREFTVTTAVVIQPVDAV